jgi:hypothetical protein
MSRGAAVCRAFFYLRGDGEGAAHLDWSVGVCAEILRFAQDDNSKKREKFKRPATVDPAVNPNVGCLKLTPGGASPAPTSDWATKGSVDA